MYKRLSSLHNKRYSEILQVLENTNLEFFGRTLREGTLVSRNIKNKTYWYFEKMTDGKLEYVYIGPDSVDISEQINLIKEIKPILLRQAKDLAQSGGYKFFGPAAKILSALGDAGLFAAGAVLVGTNAFLAYQNMLGVRWQTPRDFLSTGDIDFAQSSRFSFGIPLNVAEPLKKSLLGLAATPFRRSLLQKGDPWIYQVKDGDVGFDIEFLTPLTGPEPEESKTIKLPWLGVAAQPLRFMDYLIEGSSRVVVLPERGALLANVPDPGRFALHKLIVAERRPPGNFVKKAKDRIQASAIIQVLAETAPEILTMAWEDLVRDHPTWGKIVQESTLKLPKNILALPWVQKMMTDHNGGHLSVPAEHSARIRENLKAGIAEKNKEADTPDLHEAPLLIEEDDSHGPE